MDQNFFGRTLGSRQLITLLCVTCLVLGQGVTGASAEPGDAAGFYRGKTVKLVVGYAPGGGYDTLARLLAPRLEEAIGATVVVENRPGGGGLLALNQVVRDVPDGLTVMLVNGQAAALAQILAMDAARFDLREVAWLGRMAADHGVVLAGQETPYRTLADLQAAQEPIKWAGGGKADSLADMAASLSEALGLEAKIIIGYRGSKEAALSVMRGETDAIIPSASSARKYARGERLLPLAVVARERSALFPDVPTVFESVQLDDEQAWWIDFWSRIALIGRALMTTPGVPAERVEYLSERLAGILADPAFIAEVTAKRRFVDYASTAELHDLIDATFSILDDARLSRVRTVVLEKYY